MQNEDYNQKAIDYLLPALRQHRHNYGSEEFIPAFDYDETIRLVTDLMKYVPHETSICNKPIDFLSLRCRTLNCLKAANIFYIEDLIKLRPYDLLKINNLGKRGITDIQNNLVVNGLSLMK